MYHQSITNKQHPLANCHTTMENHHAMDGKTHYFDWAIFTSYLPPFRSV